MPEEEIEEENNSEKEASNEESELEERVDETEEEIDDSNFQDFLKPSSESFSPVLERIADVSEPIRLEQEIFSPTFTENKEEGTRYNKVDYETAKEELTIKDNLLVKQPEPVRIENIRRDLHPQLRDIAFVNSEINESRREGKNLEIDYVTKAERLNRDERLPFQQTERKYKGRPI